jgi:hypothetical protein
VQAAGPGLNQLYSDWRDRTRETINEALDAHLGRVREAIDAELERRASEAAQALPEDESQEAEAETAAEFAELRGRREPGEEG